MGCCTRDESSLISMPRPVIMLGGWGICSWQLSRDAVRRPFPPCFIYLDSYSRACGAERMVPC